MGIFDKKICDICSEKIGLLGNRKLEDGNMCKDCARKLSPFFTGRKKSSVAEIKEQLLYREKNRAALSNFTPNVSFGEYYKIYTDAAKGSFVVSRRSPSDWDDENPDVIPLSSVYGCNARTEEDNEEIYAVNSEGEEVSYNPPRYRILYDFYVTLNVNHPWFDEIEIKINDEQVEFGAMEYNRYMQISQQITAFFSGGSAPMNTGFQQAPVNGQPHMNYQQPLPYAQPNQYAQPNMYTQPQPYAQQQPYAQPSVYAQQNTYAQPNAYPQQNPYAQQNPYGQQNMYVQQNMQPNSWTCRNCNGVNTAGNFCAFCGAPKNC